MIRIKTKEQIDGIRRSCKALAQLFEELIPHVKPGVSTKQLDDFCVDFITKIGGKPAWYAEGFPGAACISINEEVIHGVPSKNKFVQECDLVSLDIGIDLGGYISDACRTVPVGKVSPERLQLLEVTTNCLAAGIAACQAGKRVKAISKAVFELASQYNYGVVYEYCGHGVGLSVHEPPNIPNVPYPGGPNERLRAGMVVAIEPMINLGTDEVKTLSDGWTVVSADGSCSCHMENTVAIFEDHTEVLTILD
ncbi:methionine aminopeptidase, type I [Treponema phagedenis F0421]|uniref:type I methionyl aminopeptidase n=1 Tax=Treponema phagedenis TaxID=162 RepID=UPI0001F63AC3|nr:type I methionyl aminopeptidase [Treponema phagedenis]EFW38840.1 methionine aminopeptidase, type I [Treponema phagedenis F0421]